MNVINIKTANGSMTINLDIFFPCNQARCKKLFRVIRQFSYLNNVQEITERLNRNFTDRIHSMREGTKKKALLEKNLEMLGSLEM